MLYKTQMWKCLTGRKVENVEHNRDVKMLKIRKMENAEQTEMYKCLRGGKMENAEHNRDVKMMKRRQNEKC